MPIDVKSIFYNKTSHNFSEAGYFPDFLRPSRTNNLLGLSAKNYKTFCCDYLEHTLLNCDFS
jgi:hypothetical protein